MSLELSEPKEKFFGIIHYIKKKAGALGEHGVGLLGHLGHHQVQTYSYVLAFVGVTTFVAKYRKMAPTTKLGLLERLALNLGVVYRYHAAQFPRRKELIKNILLRELKPPTLAELPAIKRDFQALEKALQSQAYRNLTVKEALVYTAVFVEVICWFFVGEIIGRRNHTGYLVPSTYVSKKTRAEHAAIDPRDSNILPPVTPKYAKYE